MNFEIVTDTCANLSEEILEENQIHVMSLSFFVEGKEYYSYEPGKQTDLTAFYQMMREKKEITTSLVNVDRVMQCFEPLLEAGKDILYICFSSGLSGTYQAATIAMEELREKYPSRKIFVVDSLAAALGQGLLVHFAIEQRKEGKSIEEVYNWQMENRLKVCHWFTVDDLFFLKRGGRVSAATAVLGTALNIKPVLHVDNEGHLINMEKARGRKKSLDALVRRFEETAIEPGKTPIYISHGDCLEDAEYVADQLRKKFGAEEFLIRVLDPVIGAHAGPGTVALFFFGEER